MKCCSHKTGPEARVANGALVVSFPDAAQPRVWRRALGETPASVTELRAEDGKHLLVMTDARTGQAETIGAFADKTAALAAWQAVNAALLGGDIALHAHGATSGRGCPARGLLGRFVRLALWLAALAVVLLVILFMFMPLNTRMVGNMPVKAPPPVAKTGVPVPADELFGG